MLQRELAVLFVVEEAVHTRIPDMLVVPVDTLVALADNLVELDMAEHTQAAVGNLVVQDIPGLGIPDFDRATPRTETQHNQVHSFASLSFIYGFAQKVNT